ncbi:ATP-dependent protease La Type I [Kaumoebavirus]|uniref:ATP-dependent protease La Type I n=1 Tax=Kaumoebavirus TaxID=1859492 RepID=UPI0009C2AE7A|nr:ATP-dependent protease La Type I [Kaumoebavirus]ARA72162.1 ATP-dependent protease La Type I [Kaumoebavirus]
MVKRRRESPLAAAMRKRRKLRKIASEESSSTSSSSSSEAENLFSCVVCGEAVDDGEQLCRKTYCENEKFEEEKPKRPLRKATKLRNPIHISYESEEDSDYVPKKPTQNNFAKELEAAIKEIVSTDITTENIVMGEYPSKVRNSMLLDFLMMQTREVFSPEYFKYHGRIKNTMARYNRLSAEDRSALINFHGELSKNYVSEEQYEVQLMRLELPIGTKSIIMEKLQNYYNLPSSSEEKGKLHIWLKYALNMPLKPKDIAIPENPMNFELELREKLDSVIFGMNEVKERLLNMAFTHLYGSKALGTILALAGPPGIGKTYCAEILAKVLDRPFIRIGLGGVSDNSKLIGHSFTYVGAVPGEIVKGLHAAKCSNPVIYLDEIDKVSDKTADINSILTLLLDSVQNHAFVDEYLGFPVDVSQVFWIASMNDVSKVNHIVADRLEIINLREYTAPQKIEIARRTLWKDACKKVGVECRITDEMIKKVLSVTDKESGVRQLKRNLLTILQTANRRSITSGEPLEITEDLLACIKKKEMEEPAWASIYL